MKTKAILTIVGIIAVIIVLWFVFATPTAEEEAVDTSGEQTQVEASPRAQQPFTQRAPDSTPGEVVESDEEEPTASPNEVVISMEDTGFTPENITITAGTTVTFVNTGQAAHWPASDVHPTHEILSEFDAKRGLTTGETYSYTFTEPGTWNFHDHLRPNQTGTITVE